MISISVLASVALLGGQPTLGPMIVGEDVSYSVESNHPYGLVHSVSKEPQLVDTKEIYLPEATYVAPYFSRLELAPGDYLILRSPDNSRSWRYEGYGKGTMGRDGGFWGIHISGERAVIELYSTGQELAWGYEIDTVARGFRDLDTEAICGTDDKLNASCYAPTDPAIYNQGRAVARLLINGSGLCTGWLVGSEGHLMTNNHCISTPTAAMNTNYEFGAEGTCPENCGQLQCDGEIVTTTATLVKTSSLLDYTLVQLSVNPTAEWGYFQLRNAGPSIGERIYIPQHPGGRGKELAVVSTDAMDPTGFPEVANIFNSGGRILATYFADTEGGSSGSPVVGHADNCAIVVHSGTFGCPGTGNTGTVSDQVVADLGMDAPLDSVVVAGQCTGAVSNDFMFGDSFGDTVLQ
ncbi:MAG: hypothetical protein DHS20C11_33750 [Lysobacteraceae bacterium]|nr:MAG: hypothetical protein DHS20C11_33750 [Xanthomonadaceae bacterium]